MGWVLLVVLMWLKQGLGESTTRTPKISRIFWEQLNQSGLVPVEVNVPDTITEMAQGMGQVYVNMQEWWQGASPTKVVTSAPEVKKKKKKTDKSPHKNVVINVMKTENLSIEPESKNVSIIKRRNKIQNKSNTQKSKKKKKPHQHHNNDGIHIKKKKKPEAQEVHVIHHYDEVYEHDDHHGNYNAWEDDSDELDFHELYEKPVKKKKKKTPKKKKHMKKKAVLPTHAHKNVWPIPIDINNFMYFCMGLFGVWPLGY